MIKITEAEKERVVNRLLGNNTQTAIDMFLKAEELNRDEKCEEAIDLKLDFRELMKTLTKKDQKHVEDYLQSVGA